MSDIVIEVKNVSKDFVLPHQKKNSVKSVFTGMFERSSKSKEVQHALKDISFEIGEGEFFGIVGRNGSGKSTLLKILAGIYQPTNGGVRVSGKLVPFIELGVGFNPELSGRENVYLNGALLGFERKVIDDMYEDIVKFAELEKFMDQKLKNYSSGMQVRLAFSMAIRAEADILLIDEVLAVGDADFQRKCFRYFKSLKKNKKTVVFVSHDMNAVREYCDRAVLIEKSNLVKEGPPQEIAEMYEKLLAPNANDSSQTGERWGDGVFSIKNPKIEKVTEEEIKFEMTVVANEGCDDPVIGFGIKDSSGVVVMGTNTILARAKIHPMKKGDKKTISWSFPNILADGDYWITLAAQYDSGATNGDWWEHALQIKSIKPNHSPYVIDPKFTVKIS